MDRVEAEVHDDRKQDRRSQNDDADIVHQHSHQHEEDVDHHHDDDGVGRDRIEEVQYASGEILKDVKAREHRDGVEHDHDNARCDRAFDDDVEKGLPVEPFVDEEADRDAVENGKGRGLGRRHDAAVDAPEYHYRHDKCRYGEAAAFHEHLHTLFASAFYLDKYLFIVAQHPDIDGAEQDDGDYSRPYGGEEAGEDGDAAYPGEDDQRRVRRDKQSKQRGVCHQGACVSHRVTAGAEARKHDRADTGEGRAGRAADGAEYGAGDYGDDAETAADMTDKDVDHVNEFFSDLAALHDPARENEHRDGDERY